MEENARCGEIAVLLDQLEDLIEEGKQGFLSTKISVDKEEMIEIIRDIRLKLPTEVQQSVWIVEERNKILSEAQKDAAVIRQEANEELEALIDQHEVTRYAKEQADNIVETAKEDARQMHRGAVEYAEDTCKDVEQKLKVTLDSIHQEVQDFESYITDLLRDLYDNRQELKALSNQIDSDEKEEH